MRKPKTLYHIILDRSGSMCDCTNKTINGINEQIQLIRQLKEQHPDQDITMGLTLFNGKVELVFADKDPFQCPLLDSRSYVPDGSTSLLDAVGYTLNRLEKNPEVSAASEQDTYVIIILTDGYENSSQLYKFTDIRSMIARLKATDKWTFSFLGATIDAVQVAESFSIDSTNSRYFSKDKMDEEVWMNLSDSMNNYIALKKSGTFSKSFLKNK